MKIKRIIGAVLATVLAAGTMTLHAAAAVLPFKDVAADKWYYRDVKLAYESGLINGRDTEIFDPDGTLTYAEAVKLAACMHQKFTGASAIPVISGYGWYVPYVEYSKKAKIIFKDYNWNANITRAEYMDIFARALPVSELSAINQVAYGAIPDVTVNHRYAYSIYLLYRAGIVQGRETNLTCYPDSFVERSEVAAILTRMMDKKERIKQEKPALSLEQGIEKTKDPLILPWEVGGKHPKDYTLEDFEALTERQREIFLQCEPESPAYKAWLEKDEDVIEETIPADSSVETFAPPVIPDDDVDSGKTEETEPAVETREEYDDEIPWMRKDGKPHEEYTLADYEKLTEEHKALFLAFFLTPEECDAWLVKVGLKEAEEGAPEGDSDEDFVIELPWDKAGAKPHEAYTLADYEKLTAEQKELFLAFFVTPVARDAWLVKVGLMSPDDFLPDEEEMIPEGEPEEDFVTELPWDKAGAKPHEEYTRADYEKLTAEEKELFLAFFPSPEECDAWLIRNGLMEPDPAA